jgi:ABC-type transporter Mla subunit MlaD
MAKNRNALGAGIFMVLTVAAGIAIVIGIAGSGSLTQKYSTYEIGFSLQDNLGGLARGDDVRLGGWKVGAVRDIYVKRIPDGKCQIIVAIALPDQYKLTQNAQIEVATSLTGTTALNVTDLGSGVELASGQVLPGTPDFLTVLKGKVTVLLPKLNDDLDQFHATLNTFQKAGSITVDVHELAADLHVRLQQLTDSATAALDSIRDLVGPSTGDFHQAVANVRDITGGLKTNIPPLTKSLQKLFDQLNATVAKVQGTLDGLKPAVANANDALAGAQSIIARNQGRVDEIIVGLKKTADNLSEASIEIRHSPWRLLYKPTPDEAANMNLYDAARQFADGAGDLSDAATALRDALKDKNANPAKVQKLYDDLSEQFKKFNTAEDDLWKKVRE